MAWRPRQRALSERPLPGPADAPQAHGVRPHRTGLPFWATFGSGCRALSSASKLSLVLDYALMQKDSQTQTKKRSLKSNFLYQASYQVLLILIPLVTTPYLSRTLGAEGVGVFSYTQAIANYFVMFATLGMSTYGVREIAAAGDDRDARSRTFCSAYASQLLVSLVVVVVYALYTAFAQPAGGVLVALVWGFWVFSAAIDISWMLFGVEEFKIPTIINIITKLATLIIIFGFVHGPGDLWLYCLAISGSLCANQVLLWPLVRRYINFVRPSWGEVVKHFKPNLVLFIPVIAITLYTSMDKVLLGAMAGMVQAGFFEYSEKLSKMPLAIVTAMGTVMLPRMTASLAEGKREEALGLLENAVWAMMAMAFALAFGIAAIAPEFAPVFLGEEFASCDVIMMVLAIVIPVISMTNVIGRQWLIPMQRDKYYTISVCIGAVVNIAVNLVLIPMFGAMGAAIATVTAELAVLASQMIFARGELPFGRYAKNAFPYAIIGALMFVAVRLTAGPFNSVWGLSIQGLVLEILVGIVVFLLLAVVWALLTHDSRARALLHRK